MKIDKVKTKVDLKNVLEYTQDKVNEYIISFIKDTALLEDELYEAKQLLRLINFEKVDTLTTLMEDATLKAKRSKNVFKTIYRELEIEIEEAGIKELRIGFKQIQDLQDTHLKTISDLTEIHKAGAFPVILKALQAKSAKVDMTEIEYYNLILQNKMLDKFGEIDKSNKIQPTKIEKAKHVINKEDPRLCDVKELNKGKN